MTTPKREAIREKAIELFHQDRFRNGDPSFDITPTDQELQENGHWQCALSELMRDNASHAVQEWKDYDAVVENLEKKPEQPKSNAQKQELPFDIQESMDTGFFISGTSQSGKTNLAKLLAAKLLNHGISVYVLDVSRAWNYNSPIANVLRVPHGGNSINVQPMRSTVLDLSVLSFEERFRFVNAFTANMYQWCKSFGYKSAPFTFVIYEEAQTYLPNGCFRSTKRYSPMIDLVTVGANFNIRFGLITQFPASVDKSPVKISQQRYFGWTTEKNDLDYVQRFIGKEWLSEIRALRRGEFLYQCRNSIQKFQCQKFGLPTTNNGFSYQYKFPIPMVS